MIKRTFDIVARIEQGNIPYCFQVVQNDKDVYALHIRITEGDKEIDYTQVSSATITFALANGAVVQSDPERLAISSGGITYEMGTTEISCPGKVLVSIQLFGSSGERLTTARFQFEVVADLITPGAVQSESRFPILQQLVADVEQLKQDIVNLQIPDGSIMDVKLSDAAGQIKQRFASHMADYASHMADYASHMADYASHKADYADLKGYIGYTEDDIYGVEADFENKKFTRLAGAVNKNPGADFDSIKAFGGRKRCILTDDGVVLAYYGEPGYVETGKLTQAITIGEEENAVTYPVGTPVQVMVEQPKFYYKVVPLQLEPITDGIGYHLRKARYYVSDTPKVGFKVHPAFVRNGVEVDKIYLSAYEGSIYDESAGTYLLADEQIADFNADKLSSIAYAKPASGLTQNLTRANARKLANNRGVGWQLSDVLSASVTQMLFIIEYASFNIQDKIGLGFVNKPDDGSTNMSELTGTTINLGNASGMAAGTNGLTSVSYRGEENPWGNIWKWVDGLNIEAKGIHQAYWADSGFADDIKTSPYKNCGFTLAKANGYVSAFGYSEDCDFLFLPSEVIGASNLPVGDYFYQNHNYNGFLVARLGGLWNGGSLAGAFSWNVESVSGGRGRFVGGRLLYVPQ